jgi:hypothetical protein
MINGFDKIYQGSVHCKAIIRIDAGIWRVLYARGCGIRNLMWI